MRRHANGRAGIAGFTLIEALVATALMGIVLTALASLAGQWLPNWNRGIARAQSSEVVGVALERLVGDIGAAQHIMPGRQSKSPLFEGAPSAIIFVRPAFGPNARPGLEVVRIAETRDGNATALVRSVAPFMPSATDPPTLPGFADPMVLLHAPYRVSFAYAGRDGAWKNSWQNVPDLPTVVRVTVRLEGSDRALSVSTAALIHVDMPVLCLKQKGQGQGMTQAQAQAQAQNLQIQAQARAQALGQAPDPPPQAQGQGQGPGAGPGAGLGPSCDTGAKGLQNPAAAAAAALPAR
jgi:general secretion pathway protein J